MQRCLATRSTYSKTVHTLTDEASSDVRPWPHSNFTPPFTQLLSLSSFAYSKISQGRIDPSWLIL